MKGSGYCIHCKKKVKLIEGKIVYFKNGTPAEKGKCPICGGGVIRMITKVEKEELKAKQEEKPHIPSSGAKGE